MGSSSDFALGVAGIPSASPMGNLGYSLYVAHEATAESSSITINTDLLLPAIAIGLVATILIVIIVAVVERVRRRR